MTATRRLKEEDSGMCVWMFNYDWLNYNLNVLKRELGIKVRRLDYTGTVN